MISVIVPVYKVEKYLSRCVDSILAQTYSDLEIILVDDGSPDRCGEICDEYAKKDARIRVIHKSNGGLSDARNAGIEAATGEFICFIDSDDYIAASMLMRLTQLQQQCNADIACCGVCDVYEGRHYTAKSDSKTICYTGKEALKDTLAGRNMAGTICNKLIRMKILGEHRFLVGKIYEDAFFMPKLMLAAKCVAATTEPLYFYWHRKGSITTVAFEKKHMDIIEAYEETYDFVMKCCPALEEAARFRICWANFIVLDKMLQVRDYKKYPEYEQVVAYLKQNAAFIIHCNFFQKSRRIAAMALKLNIGLYSILSKLHNKKIEAIE